ncbi:unnamed protein product [Adineta steineri]|uniref:Uncharacterized protein n=1 Tax=Adineta steineri TaxID=433720 RepID=A0A814GVC5_9BILA|nr:unnamed protein product [Adineta steineri]CAF1001713.1 unnamed protein product [Adineta steineri]
MNKTINEYNDLFHHCVRVLNEYNDTKSEKIFLEEYFQLNKVLDQSFVSIVLTDCIRHSPLLKIIIEVFYKTDDIHLRKSDENIYKVIIYIIFFQLDLVGLPFFRGFIDSIKSQQIYQLLQFLLSETHLLTIKAECLKLYEEEYINEKIIRVIHRYLPDLRELSKKLKERPLSSEPIKFKSFNLTIPKPRTTSISKDTVKVEDCRLKSQEQIKLRKLHENKPNQRRAISAIEKSSQTHFRAKPLPNFQTNKIPVKLNLATVLKENQLYKKQEDDIHRRLDYLEAGGKDAHEFLQWQQTMQQQDYEQKLNTIERKKLEGKISYEEAILAKQRLTNENRQIANELKRQTRETIEFHVKEKLKEEQKMKQLIEEIINGRDNTKLAQQKLQQYKTDFVKQYKEDTKQLMKQTLEEAEIEMRQRMELIQQIRAIESIPIDRSKPVDLTSIVGHGVHDEMSMNELRERLELIKFEREKERESRRDQIIKDKQIKEKLLTNTVQSINKHKNGLTTQTIVKKQRNTSAPPLIHKNNSEIQQLKNHLESIKNQRIIMERLRRKFSKLKRKSFRSTKNDLYEKPDDDNIYVEPREDELSNINTHFDGIAEELLIIAKKSSHTIRLAKLHNDLLTLKTFITQKLNENSKELFNANKQINVLKRNLNKQPNDNDPDSTLSIRYNRSFASDRSMADTTSCYSIWSPNNSILSSSLTTPTFRRRLAETSTSDINYSSVVQEHFVYLYQQLCSNCSKCSCYQTFIRNQIQLEYLSICSYNEQLKSENDFLQRLLADCKYSYEKQYVLFNQYEQYLIEYEHCIQIQYELIKTLQELIDRFQITSDKRKLTINNHEKHVYQKLNDNVNTRINYGEENEEIFRTISVLHEQCQRQVSQLPKRAQLYSYSREQFHPPANVSGVVDVADLEISVLLVDLLTLKHENNELRWTNDRLLREKKSYKSKVAVLELTNKYFQLNNVTNISSEDSSNELIQREKTLRLYVYRLYDLLQRTSEQVEERQIYYENLIYQIKIRNRNLIDQIRRIENNKKP